MEEKDIINYLIALWSDFASQKGLKWNHSFLQWDIPSNIEADFALNLALPIAHKNRCSVKDTAQEIVNLTSHLNYLKAEISPQGYINYQLTSNYYYNFLNKLVLSQGKNLPSPSRNTRINIEYISANPTGELHLGNLRSGVIGDALANIYEFMGYQVTREYYINDRGEQMKNLVNSVYYFYHELQGIRFEQAGEIAYPGENTKQISRQLVNQWGSQYLQKELSSTDFLVWKAEILQIMLAKIKEDLAKCGINYDNWFSETSLYQNNQHLELVKKLKAKNLSYEKEGAIFFQTTLIGDEKDRVIIKKDDDFTYFFSDILYHLNKLNRADYLINFWGADHHGYVERVKAACQLLGYDKEKLEIILTQMVSLLTAEGETKKFSKRAGNSITINEALEWLGKDQLRFALLEKEANIHLTINKDLLQKEREKSRLYYLQYAHARCHQLLEKAKEKNLEWSNENNVDLEWSKSEKKILKHLVRFSLVIKFIIEENKPHHLIYYLLDLTQEFQTYYQNNVILSENEPKRSKQRILLTNGVKIILAKSLNLLGIEAPSLM